MNLVVVGSGYVGLVSGACLADKGHRVICVDISEERIEGLKRGEVPIYEPGLDAIIARNADTGALSFTTSLPEAMREADIFCIAVGTPPDEDGSADLRHVLAVAREIGQHMERPALIINKSTVPVGTAEKVRAGDVLVALGSSGLHSNGYSLVRRVIEHAGWDLEREVPEFGRALGQELLEPTRLYTRVCLAMLETLSSPAAPGPVHALSHITGGGLAANVARVLPAGLIADVDRASWTVPPVFSTVRELGSVPWEDLEGTLNLGVGMVAVVDPSAVDAILRVAEGSDIPAWVLGEVHEARTYEAQDRVVSGTKGVDGGAVDIHGVYRTS